MGLNVFDNPVVAEKGHHAILLLPFTQNVTIQWGLLFFFSIIMLIYPWVLMLIT